MTASSIVPYRQRRSVCVCVYVRENIALVAVYNSAKIKNENRAHRARTFRQENPFKRYGSWLQLFFFHFFLWSSQALKPLKNFSKRINITLSFYSAASCAFSLAVSLSVQNLLDVVALGGARRKGAASLIGVVIHAALLFSI